MVVVQAEAFAHWCSSCKPVCWIPTARTDSRVLKDRTNLPTCGHYIETHIHIINGSSVDLYAAFSCYQQQSCESWFSSYKSQDNPKYQSSF